MKKSFAFILIGLLISLVSSAQSIVTIDGIEYDVSGPEAIVKRVYSSPDTLVIPESIEVDGYTLKVTRINRINHDSPNTRTLIALGVKYLDDEAFYGCGYLENYKFRDLETVGNSAFNGCTNIRRIDFGQKLQSLGRYVFTWSIGTKLEYIIFPATLNKVDNDAFSGLDWLTGRPLKVLIYLGRNFGYPSYLKNTPQEERDKIIKAYSGRNLVTVSDEQEFTYTGEAPQIAADYVELPYFNIVDSGATSLNKEVGEYKDSMVVTYADDFASFQVKVPCHYTINQAPLNIKADDKVKKYGEANPELTVSYEGFVNGEDSTVLDQRPQITTVATKNSKVGEYDIIAQGAASKNYQCTYTNGTLTVEKQMLNASVGNYARAYGEDNPAFEVKYEGFVNGEDATVLREFATASTEATSTSNVGVYPITVSGGSAENYEFAYTPGELTINKAKQTVTWVQDLSNLYLHAQVKLEGKASSGLPLTYQSEDPTICSVYTIDDETFLDCKKSGTTSVSAMQGGDDNYHPSMKVYMTVTINQTDGIEDARSENQEKVVIDGSAISVKGLASGETFSVYDAAGKIVYRGCQVAENLKKGVYFIRYNGRTSKVILW